MYKLRNPKEFFKKLKKEAKEQTLCSVKIQNGIIDVFFNGVDTRNQITTDYTCDCETDDKFIFLSSIHTRSNLFDVLCHEDGFSIEWYQDTYHMKEKENCEKYVSQIIFHSKKGDFEHKELCSVHCQMIQKTN